MFDEVWPPIFARRHMKEEVLRPERLPKIWRGDEQDEYAEAAIIATAAIALRLMEKAKSPDDAMQLATTMWQTRDKSRH